jgi:hypothetical protein
VMDKGNLATIEMWRRETEAATTYRHLHRLNRKAGVLPKGHSPKQGDSLQR